MSNESISPPQNANSLLLSIGDITISVSSDPDSLPLVIRPNYRDFTLKASRADLSLRVHYADPPEFPSRELIFESGGPWRLFRHHGRYLVELVPSSLDSSRLAVFAPDFSSGDLYISPRETTSQNLESEDSPADPFQEAIFNPTLDEIMMVNFLARRRLGVIVHALGLIDSGTGLLFCGVSGAGKSTLAHIWNQTDATLLSDDRIIIRPIKERFWIYGTPWHGDAFMSSPQKRPLDKLFVIRHDLRNTIRRLSTSEAATQLLVRCFPTFYDRDGMEFTLELLARIASEIPCFELGFVNNADVIDFVRGLA